MSASNERLIQQFTTSDTPLDAVSETVQELEATEEGRAWLEATANLEKVYKHKRVISAADPSDADSSEQADDVNVGMSVHAMGVISDNFDTYSNKNSASGNFYSIPLPFGFGKVGVEINSDNAKRKFEIKDKYLWLAAVGAQAGTLYYDDINDLSGESACRVSSIGPWFGVWFARDENDVVRGVGQKRFYAAFQAANVGLVTPDTFWLKGGKWSST